MYDILICPNCNKEVTFTIDEWGYTPFHLHCNNCDINIGATSLTKCAELFINKYNKKHTYLEYYGGKIKELYSEERI